MKISGIYDRPYLAHPVDVVAPFNGSITTGKLLTLDQLLLDSGREILTGMATGAVGILSEAADGQLLDHTRAKIRELSGVDPLTMRPPYGSCNDFVNSVAAKQEISFINWSVDTLDRKYKDADTAHNAIMKDAKDGIILCHDLHKSTVVAMELGIPVLLAEGYQRVTVTELLESEGEKLTSGKVYFKR